LRKLNNDELKVAKKAKGEVISTKRQPTGPKPGFMVEGATLETRMLSMILRVLLGLFYCLYLIWICVFLLVS
jgi:hypothetical protein